MRQFCLIPISFGDLSSNGKFTLKTDLGVGAAVNKR
jgi:hypothetical protein